MPDPAQAAWVGILAAPLAGAVAARFLGRAAAAWAFAVTALSPIHVLAIRHGGTEAALPPVLLLCLAVLVGPVRRGSLGVFGAVGAAIAAAAAGALLGYLHSPLEYGDGASWIPATTGAKLVRCAGASLTRVIGLEYQLVVPQARYLLPLTLAFVALMARGAGALPSAPRALLATGAVAPFVLGVGLALASGRVTPLQASRLTAALPFTSLLLAAGLASLRGRSAWAAGALVLGSLAAFLALALVGLDPPGRG